MNGLVPGSRRCICPACGRKFSAPTTFDRHQELRGPRYGPTLVCHDPATRGLVERDGWWSGPAMPKEAFTARQGATKGGEAALHDPEAQNDQVSATVTGGS